VENRLRVAENETDEHFLVAAAQRDPARFAELYEANFSRVYAYIARRVEHRHDAEDLTAEGTRRRSRLSVSGVSSRGRVMAGPYRCSLISR
jgi:hypothetical protein